MIQCPRLLAVLQNSHIYADKLMQRQIGNVSQPCNGGAAALLKFWSAVQHALLRHADAQHRPRLLCTYEID